MEDTLQSRQAQREYAFNIIYSDFLNQMVLLKKISVKVFEIEDEEYAVINKFGRGIWLTQKVDETFEQEEMEMEIIRNIAEEYGAFMY